jgi:FMN-dependent NADH-azoreductase
MERSVTLRHLYLKFATTYSGFQRGNRRTPDKAIMKLLHIDSSALGANSVTRELTAAIVARWQDKLPGLEVIYRDLDAEPLPHLTGPVLTKADAAAAEASEQALQQFLETDVLVIGAPMYNFSIPSTLKAWIDRVAVAGRTFRYTENGPEGLVRGKKLIIASGRGGIHTNAPTDFQEPYLRQVFGFLGITDVEFVRAEGVGYSPQHRADAIGSALANIPEPLRQAA